MVNPIVIFDPLDPPGGAGGPRRGARFRGCVLTCAALAPAVWLSGWALSHLAPSDIALAPLLLGLWLAVSGLLLAGLRAHVHTRWGPGNALTAIRAAGTVALAGVALHPAALAASGFTPVLGLAAVLFALDGLDGVLARRAGLASRYGARFDMEVDAALTLVLSTIAWRTGAAGPEILLLVLPYYASSGLVLVVPWLGVPLPPSLGRKLVCVAQVAIPVVILAAPLPMIAARGLVLAMLAAVLASFAKDIRHLYRCRR